MLRLSVSLFSLLALSLPAVCQAANPWEDLMGRKPQIWHDPDGRFQLDLPTGWKAQHLPGQELVNFVRQSEQGHSAQVQVEIQPLPPGVKAVHFNERIQQKNRKSAPRYSLKQRDKVKVSGLTAVRTHFIYQVRNNAQMQREVVQLVLVSGEKGYVITLETMAGARGLFWEEFQLMVKGFSTGFGTGGGSGQTTRGPRKRQRVRAGEMINPNVIRY